MRTKGIEIKQPELYTASDLARFCEVDLKTIHNWADKGAIPFFRTPGRHMRFRGADIVEFLNKHGFSIPSVLKTAKPRVVVIDSDTTTMAATKRALGKRFDVHTFSDPIDALIALSTLQPDCLVIDLDVEGFDGVHFLTRLKALDATRHTRTIVTTNSERLAEKALEAGAVDVRAKEDVDVIRECLEQLTGLSS